MGSFASVYEGIHCAEGKRTKVAIKCFDLRRVLKSELDQICQVSLPRQNYNKSFDMNVSRLYDIVDASPRHVSFILEMCHGGDLLSRVQENGAYNESDAMLVMKHVFSALNTCIN